MVLAVLLQWSHQLSTITIANISTAMNVETSSE